MRRDAWPVGWKSEGSPRLLAPKMFEFLTIEIDGFTLSKAVEALQPLAHATAKGLLRRVIGKIFNDAEIKGWCNEFEARNASSREARTQSAG